MTKTNGNLKVMVPTFIPLAEAVRKYNLTEEVLTRLIRDGRIDGAQLPSGDLLVSDDGLNEAKTKEQIIEEKFGNLIGQPITVTEAAEKYDLHRNTLLEWSKNGYIAVLKHGYRMELDEAEVAYCAEIHYERKELGITRVPLLDENGLAYQLKHPKLFEYRRRKKNRIEE